jgi:DUF177 domain-containing protein
MDGRPGLCFLACTDMLLLDVARLREGSDPLERTIAPGDLAAEEDYRVVAPVVLEATVAKDKANVRIVGHASTTLEMACSRCLDGYEVPVDARFDLLYLPAVESPGEEEVEVRDEDINTAFYRDGSIDLAELLHEQLYLMLPMKPLCRENCQGLCPLCGVNRNVTTCSCEARWEDPRFAGLKALLKESDDA